MPLPLYLALAHVSKRVLQSALTVAGVAVGVAVLITALALTNGFVDELLDSTLLATPHVTLQGWGADAATVHDPAVQERIAAHPEVVAVAPFLTAEALIARRADAAAGVSGRQGYVQLVGIDPAAHAEVLALPELRRAGERLAMGEAILGDSLALALGVVPGDEVLIQDVVGRRATLRIASTFRVGNELIDGLVGYASLAQVRAFLRAEPDRSSGWHVRIVDPARAEAVGRTLADATGLRPTAWSSLFGGLVAQLDLQRAVIAVVVFMIVLVGAFGIANVLVLTVAEKTSEIALLRALGASPRQVLTTFALEGLLLGGLGTAVGVALGAAAALYLQLQPIPLPGDLYFITRLPVRVSPWDVAWVAALALVTSTVAGLLPARRAARLDPARVLR